MRKFTHSIRIFSRFKGVQESETHFFFFVFLIIFSGRFYYLLGYEGHLLPTSSIYIILFKDVLLAVVHLFMLFKVLSRRLYKSKAFILFSVAWILLLVIGLLHFRGVGGKEWLQHYFRNFLFYAPFDLYCAFFFTSKHISFLIKYFQAFTILLVIFGIGQQLFFSETLFDSRSLSLVGDPNILAFLLYQGLLLNILFIKNNFFFFYIAIALACTIDSATSIGATISWILCFFLLYFHFLLVKDKRSVFTLYLKRIRYCFLILLTVFVITALMGKPFTLAKLSDIIIYFAFNKGNSAGTINGHLQSALLSFQVFQNITSLESFLYLLFGNFSSMEYFKLDNSLSGLLYNFGLAGLAIICFPFIYIFKKIVKNYSSLVASGSFLETKFIFFCSFSLVATFIMGWSTSIYYKYPVNLMSFILVGTLFSLVNNPSKVKA